MFDTMGEGRTKPMVKGLGINLDDDEFEFFHEFERDKVKSVIHLITVELKERATNVEFLMIPFRPQQTNESLLKMLNAIFPQGNGQPVNDNKLQKIVANTEVHTLFQGLKYIWCRLQDGEVVGWKPYLQFKYREKSKNYPKKAFLELMPQCLDSPSHASIVYDFFDLIVTVSANSRVNKMSARKISKMFALWAFGKELPDPSLADYDFDDKRTLPNNSFQDGLDQWVPATDAMFHLLLAFLKSFVPEDLETAQLPRTLKSLLFNNEYPPEKSSAYNSETILTIPLVTLETDHFSRKPWQLLERCNELLDFSNYDAFEAREDYALLKSLFKKKNNVEGISRKMSQESRRVMKEMSTKHSTFQSGWAPRKCVPNYENLPEEITVKRVDIDDYFIWTWLSSLSNEQTSERKKTFGRSLILEFEFDGFKKWVLFQESDVIISNHKRGPTGSQGQESSRLASNGSSNTSTIEKPLAKQPKTRNVTPTYEKFQKQVVPNSPTIDKNDATAMSEGYHTVISRDALEKNKEKHNVNLHSLEQKISSFWNPLQKVKKKNKTPSSSSTEIKEITNIANAHVPPQESGASRKPEKPSMPEPPQMVEMKKKPSSPRRIKKPITPPDSYDNFREDLPRTQPGEKTTSEETMKELKGIVEDMMAEDGDVLETGETTVNSDPEKEIFESLTKFDQYKPSRVSDAEVQSLTSTVPSLRIPSDEDDDNDEDKDSPRIGSVVYNNASESSSHYDNPLSAHGPGEFYRQRQFPVTPRAKTPRNSAHGNRSVPDLQMPSQHYGPPRPMGTIPKHSPISQGPQLQPGQNFPHYKSPQSDPQLVSGHVGSPTNGGSPRMGYRSAAPPPIKGIPRPGYSQPALNQMAPGMPSSPSQAIANPYKQPPAMGAHPLENSPRSRAGPVGPGGGSDNLAVHQSAPYPATSPQGRKAYPIHPQTVTHPGSAPVSPQVPSPSPGMTASPQMRQPPRSPQMRQQMSPQIAYGGFPQYPRHGYVRSPGAPPPAHMAAMQVMPPAHMPPMHDMPPPMQGMSPVQGMPPPMQGMPIPKSPTMPAPMQGVPSFHAQGGKVNDRRQVQKRLHDNIRSGNFGI